MEDAQNLIPEKPRSERKVLPVTITHPCGDRAHSCLGVSEFESECSPPETPALLYYQNKTSRT